MKRKAGQLSVLAIGAALAISVGVRAELPLFTAMQSPRPTPAVPLGEPTLASSIEILPPVDQVAPRSVPCEPSYGFKEEPFCLPSNPYPYGVPANSCATQPAGDPCLTPTPMTMTTLAEDIANMLVPPELGPAPCIDCPTYSWSLWHGYSSWRGITEGSGINNNGLLYGAGYGTKLGALSDYTGIAAQVGGSVGLYDLNGRDTGYRDNQMQQQYFLTAGIFRKADQLTNFSWGVVWDGMNNVNFGQYAVSPFLHQIRFQLAYALNQQHEIGLWSSIRLNTANRDSIDGPLQYRAVDQFNLFWHHRFAFGADGWTWIGFPDSGRLGHIGSLGDYLFGGNLVAPLSPRLGAFTELQYMRPTARMGALGAIEEDFYVSVGIIFYPGFNSRNPNVTGGCWTPYLPVATNGSFLVDTNRTF